DRSLLAKLRSFRSSSADDLADRTVLPELYEVHSRSFHLSFSGGTLMLQKKINQRINLKKTLAFAIVSMLLVSCGCGTNDQNGDEGLDGATTGNAFAPWQNHPGIETSGSKDFAFLINNYAEGRPSHDPWDSTYFPYTGNGTAASSADGGGSPVGKYDAA